MPLRYLIPLSFALALGAQNPNAPAPGAGINFFSLDKEIALGQQLAGNVRRENTALADQAVQDYVVRLGNQLAAQAGGPDFPYSFTVLADRVNPQPNPTEEPTALPGGPIFVPVRLILQAQSEAELAGMLAHAIEHVAE